MPQTPRSVLALAYPGVQMLDIAGPLEAFSLASDQLMRDGQCNSPAYSVAVTARETGPFATRSGLAMLATKGLDETPSQVDTLLIPGAASDNPVLTGQSEQSQIYTRWIRQMQPRTRRIGSVCNGALLLAQTGLLDRRRVTTHWEDSHTLQTRHPALQVCSDIVFIRDGDFYTSAGITAGIDLALAMIEDDYGRSLALKVAKRMVVYLRRRGDQAQFSDLLAAQSAGDRFATLIDWMHLHRASALTIDQLAARASMSPRNFARCFTREIGVPPALYVERLRVEAARNQLASGSASLEQIAAIAGFGTATRMRRAFQRQIGVSPAEYRTHFGSA